MTETPGTAGAAALEVIELARAGQFAEIASRFAPSLRPMVPAGALAAAWAAETGSHGAVTGVGAPASEPAGPGTTLVRVPVRFEREDLTVAVELAGEAGWITGIQLLPASAAAPTEPWAPPPYADPGAFTEAEVTLGDGPLAVPGTLTLPRRDGPVPAVALLSGSGPLDRDETIGRNKPFKDLAWGLASAGLAVLRFDKVTLAHPREVAADQGFTVTQEYVPHGAAAVRLLRAHPAVAADRVFVAGHSLGGTVAPRVAAAAPPVAGLVLLAGGAQPMHWAAVRQFRYMAALRDSAAPGGGGAAPDSPGGGAPDSPGGGGAAPDSTGGGAAPDSTVEVVTRQAEAVDDPGLSAATPADRLPFGVPAAYWLDLRGYDPAAAAAALGLPVLVVQGGRDYQVTVADDLSRWQAALAGRPDVTIRVYPADNHLFFPGSGPSAPAEYEPAQHVDPAMVADVAAWLAAAPAAGPARRPDPAGQ
jgi:dienelactone hydrolase